MGSAERLRTTLTLRLRPGGHTGAALASAQRGADDALQEATARVAGSRGTLGDAAETGDAARRHVQPLRTCAATDVLAAGPADESYSRTVDNLHGAIGDRDGGWPTVASDPAAGACVAILRATEAAERERIDAAQGLVAPGHGQPPGNSWATVTRGSLHRMSDAPPRATRLPPS